MRNVSSIAASFLLLSAPSEAAISIFTTSANWENAVGAPPTTVVTFEGVSGNLNRNSSFQDMSVSANSSLAYESHGYPGQYLRGYSSATITIPQYSSSFGGNFMAYYGNQSTMSLVVNTHLGEQVTSSFPVSTNQVYRGFIAETPGDYITSINVSQSSGSNYIAMDNLSFTANASPPPVPEPGVAALVGLGSLGVAVRRRRRS